MTGKVKKLVRKVIRDRNRVGKSDLPICFSYTENGVPEKLLSLLRSSKLVAAYMPLPDEPDISGLLSLAASEGAQIVYPKVDGENMDFYRGDTSGCHIEGKFGILEPIGDGTPVSASEMDLVFVPGMAFSEDGVRLGRGKGYYDKFFSGRKESGKQACGAVLIGVCRKDRVLGRLPSDEWDLTVDAILTEEGLFMTDKQERKNG